MSSPATGVSRSAPVDEDAPSLTVLIGSAAAHSIDPEQAPVVIGREAPSQIRVPDHRISRQHLELTVRNGRWVATDPGSKNGTFVNQERVTEFEIPENEELIAHLGNPVAGIAVTFSTRDAGIVYAGAVFASARRERDISQRSIAADGIMNAGALISFEKGRSWPRRATREKLEEVVSWKKGTIEKLRRDYANGGVTTSVSPPVAAVADPEQTAVVLPSSPPAREETGTSAIDSGFLAQWADQNLAQARAHRAELPAVSHRSYQSAVSRLIGQLSSLEALVHNASAAPELREIFLQVRTELRGVMLAAAESPSATSGQRMFAARDRDRLSIDDAAMLAGVPPASLRAFEAGGQVPPADKVALESFLASLP